MISCDRSKPMGINNVGHLVCAIQADVSSLQKVVIGWLHTCSSLLTRCAVGQHRFVHGLSAFPRPFSDMTASAGFESAISAEQ